VRQETWTGLCHKSEALSVFGRAERAERDFDPLFAIRADVRVNDLDELFDGCCLPLPTVEQLRFQPPEEALAGRIVGRASFARHRANQLCIAYAICWQHISGRAHHPERRVKRAEYGCDNPEHHHRPGVPATHSPQPVESLARERCVTPHRSRHDVRRRDRRNRVGAERQYAKRPNPGTSSHATPTIYASGLRSLHLATYEHPEAVRSAFPSLTINGEREDGICRLAPSLRQKY
jgi:hypothetical protein